MKNWVSVRLVLCKIWNITTMGFSDAVSDAGSLLTQLHKYIDVQCMSCFANSLLED